MKKNQQNHKSFKPNSISISETLMELLKVFHETCGNDEKDFDHHVNIAYNRFVPILQNIRSLITPQMILDACCDLYKITPEIVANTKGGKGELWQIKYVYYGLCRQYTISSQTEIASILSASRSNGVIMSQRHFETYQNSELYRKTYDACENHLLSLMSIPKPNQKTQSTSTTLLEDVLPDSQESTQKPIRRL